jgi:hypothetical protein
MAARKEFFFSKTHIPEDVARPLHKLLVGKGLQVWYDEMTLSLGDSLRRKIDEGLANSRYGLVILSPSFFAKEWPQKELDGLVAREDGKEKVILPIWHKVTKTEIVKFSPPLGDKLGASTEGGLDRIVEKVLQVVRGARPPVAAPAPLVRAALARLDLVAPGLGKEALEVLQEAAKGDGHIIAGQFDAGYMVMVGGRRFFDPNNPRSQAAYREGMRQLILSKYVEQTGRDFYQVAHRGYEVCDRLKLS